MIAIMRRHGSKAFILITTCLLHTLSYADTNDAATKVKWGYIGNTGPSTWAQLDPSFAICSSGQTQSPINILTKKAKKSQDELVVHYQPAPMIIMDNGNTELLIGETQTLVNEGHGLQLNFPSDQTPESITWNGKDYHLVQFHIHTPSENLLSGQSYPMEIHFVHQGANGQLAVIGVMVKAGKDNPTLQKIIDNVPKEEGRPFSIQGQSVDPASLLPSTLHYYSVAGSLTTPPCSQGVQWIVMAEAITASPAQIVKLREAAGGANARPVQPLHGRLVHSSTK